MHTVNIKDVQISNDNPFTLIAGPCQIESLEHAQAVCYEIQTITTRLDIPFIYKSSYDKANRTSADSKRGIGMYAGLDILEQIGSTFKIPVTTDVHEASQCSIVAKKVDLLQIPAFLCRQTDLLKDAAHTNKPINVKKGQFLAPWDMKQVVDKLEQFNATGIIQTDRGTSFGYNTLISDMRGIPIMKENKWPVCIDATHSVQQPGGLGGTSGGQREFVETIARSAMANGVASVFLEVHEDPDNAPSDGSNMIELRNLYEVLARLKDLDSLVKSW